MYSFLEPSLKKCKTNIYFSKIVHLGISWRTATVCVPFLYLEENVPRAVPVKSTCVTSCMDVHIASIIFLEHFH